MLRAAKWMLGIGVALVLFLAIAGVMWIVEVPFFLAFGWIRYGSLVLPQVDFDWPTIGFAWAAVAVFAVGLHAFLRWLPAAFDSQSAAPWKPRWTIAIVAISLLLFVVGTAFVGIVHQVAWLVKWPDPFLEGGLRRVVMRNQSTSQLKQMAIATHDQVEARGLAGTEASSSKVGPVHSWQTELLPYVEEARFLRGCNATCLGTTRRIARRYQRLWTSTNRPTPRAMTRERTTNRGTRFPTTRPTNMW